MPIHFAFTPSLAISVLLETLLVLTWLIILARYSESLIWGEMRQKINLARAEDKRESKTRDSLKPIKRIRSPGESPVERKAAANSSLLTSQSSLNKSNIK